MQSKPPTVDSDSEGLLTLIGDDEKVRLNRVPGVRTVLVVLSSAGMVFDVESLRQKILLTYADVAVFFRTTMGQPIGATSPRQVDLLVDFTGPRQRQGWFYSRKLKRMSRVTAGRNAGLFRARIYDRVYDESKAGTELPKEKLARERFAQREVLRLVGVAFAQSGDALADRASSIALELPAMQET